MPSSDQHATPHLDPEAFEQLVIIAGRAPSVHNTQPWLFRLADDQTIEIEVAAHRALPHSDPGGRELVISCGAALHNLLLGLRVRGLRGAVTLLPDPDQPLLLASVRTTLAAEATAAERRAFTAVFRRHTHRTGFDGPVNDTVLASELVALATAEDASLRWITRTTDRKRLIAIARAAAELDHDSPAMTRETAAWSPTREDQRDGVPRWAQAPLEVGGPSFDRLPDRFVSTTRTTPVPLHPGSLAVVSTEGDGIRDWLTAGRALQRVLLRAAEDWVFATFATPALENEELRDSVRTVLDTAAYPQMILELGYSHVSASTGRLDAAELIAPAEG